MGAANEFLDYVNDTNNILLPGQKQRVRLKLSIINFEEVSIDEIQATRPGFGDGSITLVWLCQIADKLQVRLSLIPVAFTGSGDDQSLISWYSRFGFSLVLERGCMMERIPNEIYG